MKFTKLTILLLIFLFSTKAASAAVTLRPALNLGLVGYWSMDEGAGTVVGDSSGNGSNGTATGSPAWVDGKRGKALDFNGSGDYASIPDQSNLNPTNITLGAWVKTTTAGKYIIAKDPPDESLSSASATSLDNSEIWMKSKNFVGNFWQTMGDNINMQTPLITHGYTDPYDVAPGGSMLVSVDVQDFSGIEAVTALMPHEVGSDVLPLALVKGTEYNGTWQGTWIAHDTLEKGYTTTVTAINAQGAQSQTQIYWHDATSGCTARYWVGGTGTWDASGTTHWSATSGGAGGASVPGSDNSVILDASSSGGTVTLGYSPSLGCNFNMGTFTGTFDAATFSPTFSSMGNTFTASGTSTRTLNLGSGTWTVISNNPSGIPWNITDATNLTLNAQTSTIKITYGGTFNNTFAGGGKTYNNVWFARGAATGNNVVTGSNTFNDFKDTGTVAHNLIFTAGTTQTFSTFTVSGSAGNVITINSDTTATHALVKSGGGTISSDYLNIQHSVATPSSTWYAGTHSTDNQGVSTAGSGWLFVAAPKSTVPYGLNITAGGKGQIMFMSGGTTYAATSTTSVNDGQWHYLSGTYDGENLRMYVDGVLENTNTDPSGNLPTLAGALRIGADYEDIPGNFFDGSIDEARIYNRELSGTEVANLYTSGATKFLAPNNLGLVGYWAMEEGTGTQAGDSSGNGNDGTVLSKVAGDDFNRANENPLSQGGNWGQGNFPYALKIVSNQVVHTQASSSSAGAVYNGGTFSSNQYSQAKVTAAYDISVAVRIQSGVESHYEVNIASSGVGTPMSIAKVTGGTFNTLESTSYVAQIGDIVRLTAVGSSPVKLTAYVNGVEAGSYEDSTSVFTGGRPGLRMWSMSGKFDDWEGGDVTATWADGKRGKALSFDGASNYVNAGSASSLDNINVITTAAWVKIGAGAFRGAIAEKMNWSGGGGGWWLLADTNSGQNRFEFKADFSTTAGVWKTDTGTIAAGNWYYVVVTYDHTSTTNNPLIYINGQSVTITETSTPSGTVPSDAAASFYMGAASASPSFDFFNGLIDEVRVYNRALAPSEVAALYNSSGKITTINSSQNSRLTSGLIGLWSFNGPDVSGATVYDRSGSGNNGTISGATPAIGKVGQALNFDGTDDYVDLGNPATLKLTGAMTVSAWVRQDTLNESSRFVAKQGDGTNRGWSLNTENTNPDHYSFQIASNSTTIFGADSAAADGPVAGEWTHLVGVYTPSVSTKLYKNGIEIASNTTSVPASQRDSTLNVNIGRRPDGGIFTDGIIDEVRVYNRALLAGEVWQLYNMGGGEVASTPAWACGDTIIYNSDIYNTVQMTSTYGSQCWFQENLRTTKKPDGVTDITAQAYCNPSGCDSPWGRLYDWTTAMNGSTTATGCGAKIQGICPAGWHIPSDYTSCATDDFPALGTDGGALKKTGTTEWTSPNTGATNASNWTGYPAGYWNSGFNDRGNYGYFWSSAEGGGSGAWNRYLNYVGASWSRYYFFINKPYGYSVRCVKD